MQLNFYRKLDISDGQVIWLVNPTRTFQKNFSSNVPRHCTVLYKYKNVPVDMALLWVDKKTDEEEIAENIANTIEKTIGNGIIWVLIDFEAKDKEPSILEIAKSKNLLVSKKLDIYKNIFGIKLVKL